MPAGEHLHSIYVKHFRHRYGGNAPGWKGISEQERALWTAIEGELRPAARETIDTRQHVVRIKTRRGQLRLGPGDAVDGLWDIVRRELLTNEQVRKRAGSSKQPITRKTLIAWRAKDFPAPVLTFKASGGALELWSKTDVQTWLAARDPNPR